MGKLSAQLDLDCRSERRHIIVGAQSVERERAIVLQEELEVLRVHRVNHLRAETVLIRE